MSIDSVEGFSGNRLSKKYFHILADDDALISTSKGQNARNFIKLIDSVSKPHHRKIGLADQYMGVNFK